MWRGRYGVTCEAKDCAKEFRDSRDLGNHMFAHHKASLTEEEKAQFQHHTCRPMKCDECKKWYSKKHFKSHPCKGS